MRTRQRRLRLVWFGGAIAAAVGAGGIAHAAPVTHDWTGVAKCESGGDWHINTGNGYYGGLQFSLSSWQAAGGTDYAARPDLATQEQQEMTAENLLAMQGVGAWPVCGKYLTAAPASAPAPAPASPADPAPADPSAADPSAADPSAADPSADPGGSPPPATSADPLPADTPPDPGAAAPPSDSGSSAADQPADSTGDQSTAGDSSPSTSAPSSSSTSSTTPWSQYGSGGWGPAAAGTAGTQPAVPAPGGTTTGGTSNGGPARTETGTSSASSAATTGGADGTDATSGTAQNRTSPAPVRASGRGAWEAAGQYNQTVAQAKAAGRAVPVAPGEAAYTQARTQPAATPASAPAAPVVDIGSAVSAAPMSTTSSWSRGGTSPNPATRGTGNSTGNQGTGNPGPDNTGTGDPSVAGAPSPAAQPPAGAAPPAADAPAPAAPAAGPVHADVTNSAGPLTAKGQAMADAVAGSGCPVQSMGGTRSSAVDPAGHPSGNAVDFMVGSGNKSAGDCVANFLIAHWDDLGMKYVIWQQAILQSKDGQWEPMADRGSPTANHMDHVHGEVA
jgi:hypothetical protein